MPQPAVRNRSLRRAGIVLLQFHGRSLIVLDIVYLLLGAGALLLFALYARLLGRL